MGPGCTVSFSYRVTAKAHGFLLRAFAKVVWPAMDGNAHTRGETDDGGVNRRIAETGSPVRIPKVRAALP